MGADGGTTAKRQDILSLHNARTPQPHPKEEEQQILLQSCAISGLPLYNNAPIVGDYRGKLYIKEKILQYLLEVKLDKLKLQLQFQHLKSLKDLKTVTITWKLIKDVAHFQCPITKELDEKTSYTYLRPCGCVMSYRLLLELKKNLGDAAQSKCPVCNQKFTFDYDLVIINPINKPTYEKINQVSYNYLKDVLHLSNNLEPLKKKKKVDDFIKKRKQDLDDGSEMSKRIKT
ncbi:rtf2 [Candida jiufengensis]|uniref:rtf2 n=1 Tax=Candida jiufengensis TaxID=497108 RepID=UPI002225957B|nr:rtf2 [Candida jiufengensis]KAI5953419.1 rtf2 [Candida jiufengensis]